MKKSIIASLFLLSLFSITHGQNKHENLKPGEVAVIGKTYYAPFTVSIEPDSPKKGSNKPTIKDTAKMHGKWINVNLSGYGISGVSTDSIVLRDVIPNKYKRLYQQRISWSKKERILVAKILDASSDVMKHPTAPYNAKLSIALNNYLHFIKTHY
jgi:hypothetical protein